MGLEAVRILRNNKIPEPSTKTRTDYLDCVQYI